MELREGYKQTEVGVFPEDWLVKRIAELSEVIRGASPRPKGDKRYYGGKVPRLMVQDVTRDGMYVTPQLDFLTEAGAKLSRPCKKGTLTLVCSGTVGVPSSLAVDACIHDGFLALINLSKNIHRDYLYQFFRTQQEQFDSSATHGGVFTNLTTDGVRDFLVPVPSSLEEQTAIANALSDADALIQSLTRLIAKKRQIKQGAMQTLLTGTKRLPGFEQLQGYKETDLGKAPNDWDVKSLPEIVTFIHGKAHEQFIVDTAKYEVVNSKFVSTEGRIKKYSSENFCKAKSKDILMVLSDLPNGKALAKCFYVEIDDKYAVNQRVCIYRSKKDNPKYLYYILNRNSYFLNLDDGVTQTHILNDDIKRCQLLMPSSVEEQKAIATILSDMDADITALETKLAKAQQIRQGMMQNLLTGQIRLVKAELEIRERA